MRGFGKLQKEQKSLTNYRIIDSLYVEPCSYEQLQKKTRIHRNTLKLRLNELLDDNIILKEKYTFRHKSRFRNHYFYMLNWGKKDTKQILSYLFENENKIINSYVPTSWYKLNSLEINAYKKSVLLGRRYRKTSTLDFMDFRKKILELSNDEGKLWSELVSIYNNNFTGKAIEKRNELIEKRDRLLEILIYECTQFCVDKYLKLSEAISPFNMLIFFKLLVLYRERRPFTKFWEIMERLGY